MLLSKDLGNLQVFLDPLNDSAAVFKVQNAVARTDWPNPNYVPVGRDWLNYLNSYISLDDRVSEKLASHTQNIYRSEASVMSA